MDTAVVDIKSGWSSKINWTQVIGWAVSAGTAFGIDLPKEELLMIVVGIQGVTGLTTWLFKTYFTTTVTPSSAARLS